MRIGAFLNSKTLMILTAALLAASQVHAGFFDDLFKEAVDSTKQDVKNSITGTVKEGISGAANTVKGKGGAKSGTSSASSDTSQCREITNIESIKKYSEIVDRIYKVCGNLNLTPQKSIPSKYGDVMAVYKNMQDGMVYYGKSPKKEFLRVYTEKEIDSADIRINKIGEQMIWGYALKDSNVKELSLDKVISIISGKKNKHDNGKEIFITVSQKVFTDLIEPKLARNSRGGIISDTQYYDIADFQAGIETVYRSDSHKVRASKNKYRDKVSVAIGTSYELRHSISGNSIPYLKTDLSPITIDNGNATIPYLMITRGEPNSNINAIIEFVKSNMDWSKPDLN